MTQNQKPELDEENGVYQEMVDRYEAGQTPWDSELPPPEVIDQVDALSPGLALDLGCGFGRASIYLAQHGWRVDAIDFIPKAIETAVERARAAEVGDQIQFHLASVTDLSFLTGTYDFALDVGCLHVLTEQEMQAYRNDLRRLLRAGATFLLFARLRDAKAHDDDGPRGLTEAIIRALFADGFDLAKSELGETHLDDDSSWSSAWFWFRRSSTQSDRAGAGRPT